MVLAAVALVGILIFIHESGHFFLAKLFGVGVPVYSFGWGRRLIGFEFRGTDYRLSMWPVGGYVKMDGLDPFADDGDRDSPGHLMNKPVWQRLLIHLAGPAANLALPVAVFTGLYMAGEPQVAAVIGQVTQDSPAGHAGLQAGDKVVAVGDTRVELWEDLLRGLDDVGPGQQATVTVERDGAQLSHTVTLPDPLRVIDGIEEVGLHWGWQDTIVGVPEPDSPAGRAGLQTFDQITRVNGVAVSTFKDLNRELAAATPPIELDYLRADDKAWEPGSVSLLANAGWQAAELPLEDPLASAWGLYPGSVFVHRVEEDSAADGAGLKSGDRLVAVDGLPLTSWWDLVQSIGEARVGEGDEATARELQIVLLREGRVIELGVTPTVVHDTDVTGRYRYRALLGVTKGGGSVAPYRARRYYEFTEAVPKAARDTWGIAGVIVERLGELFTGEAAVSESLGGPIQIFRDAGAAAKEGIFTWARMMALLSISVGIVNLVPVPVLDGGRILFDLIEGIRGRPLPLAIQERALQVGVLFIMGLFIMVSIFDVGRLLQSFGIGGGP